jgi:hypothetical protein
MYKEAMTNHQLRSSISLTVVSMVGVVWWSWNYKGRQIYVSDMMDKVVQFLDKFKSVGDVIANVDPVHLGLPWAGIRAILEVCVLHEADCLSKS